MPSPADMLGGLPGPSAGGGPLGGMPGPGGPGGDLSLQAMDQLAPGQGQNPSNALQKVQQALDLAHKLIMSVLPQISSMNPKVSKDLHQIGRSLQGLKLDVQKEMPVGPPPELMAGLQDMQGAPPSGSGFGVGLPGPAMGSGPGM